MSIQSSVIEQPPIPLEAVFTFPQGIPGFEEYTTFRIFHKDDGNVSAYWLESCDDPEVTFTLVDPTAYDLNFDIYLNDVEAETIEAENPFDIGVFLMLKKDDEKNMNGGLGANIGGPIVINVSKQLGLQKVLKRHKNVTEH